MALSISAHMQTDSSSSSLSDLQALQKQIRDLTALYDELQTLRQIPSVLLRPPMSDDMPFVGRDLRPEFQRLKGIEESICSGPIQDALHCAQDSLSTDGTQVHFNPRRENRKRRRLSSPASPQPYISQAPHEPCAFPAPSEGMVALGAGELLNYVKQYNEENQAKLHIWRRTADEPKAERPKVLRFTIPDVVTVYISMGYQGPGVLIENLVAFGPRERKAPHLQSQYTVYQNLSQQFARVLHLHPNITFQSLMSLLCSYERLFVDRCIGCGRVLSVEGHVPPVVRLWKEGNKEGEEGQWEPRHITCRRDQ